MVIYLLARFQLSIFNRKKQGCEATGGLSPQLHAARYQSRINIKPLRSGHLPLREIGFWSLNQISRTYQTKNLLKALLKTRVMGYVILVNRHLSWHGGGLVSAKRQGVVARRHAQDGTSVPTREWSATTSVEST